MPKKMGPEGSVPESGQEEREGAELEWGSDFGQMSWNEAQIKIAELNADLKEGEKKWRLPTRDELVAEFKKTGSTPAGFQSDYYWSSTVNPHYPDDAYVVDMNIGGASGNYKGYSKFFVRYVR